MSMVPSHRTSRWARQIVESNKRPNGSPDGLRNMSPARLQVSPIATSCQRGRLKQRISNFENIGVSRYRVRTNATVSSSRRLPALDRVRGSSEVCRPGHRLCLDAGDWYRQRSRRRLPWARRRRWLTSRTISTIFTPRGEHSMLTAVAFVLRAVSGPSRFPCLGLAACCRCWCRRPRRRPNECRRRNLTPRLQARR